MRVVFFVTLIMVLFANLDGQENVTKKAKMHLNPSLNICSSYIWRGTILGSGPAMQPSLVYSTGGFAAGVWGSYDFHGYQEADPYVYYEFPWGFSIGMTDYYYPVLRLGDISRDSGSHALELNTGFALKSFSLSANYILNEAGGAGSSGDDLYLEAGYSAGIFSAFIGAGNGWHTSTGRFNICNIGIGGVKNIRLGDHFELPLTGQIIVNPERERLYVVAGFSF